MTAYKIKSEILGEKDVVAETQVQESKSEHCGVILII
jgi:hypothetical protein